MPTAKLTDIDNPNSSAPEPQDTSASIASSSPIMNFLKDLGKGIGESAVSLMSTGDETVRKIPGIGEWLTTPITGTPADQAIAHTHQLATPANTTQEVGKGIGNAAQFLIPGAVEESGAAGLAKLAPSLGKVARPLADLVTSAASSGLVNKAQGGSFTGGAAAGAAGSALGSGLRAIAPRLAESAIGIRNTDRAFGKTPGRAILDETRGIRPETIAESGQNTLNDLVPQVERMAAQSSQPFEMNPARNVIGNAMNKATAQNASSLHSQLKDISDFLNTRFDTAAQIPAQVTPSEGLNLQRGLSKEFLGRWNPETHGDTVSAGRQAYRAMGDEFDRTVPGAADLRQRMSSLIPVVRRAESTARNAPFAQKVIGRFAAPTGALTLAGIGGAEGYREGGGPGAMAGALSGLLMPLLVATPEGQMVMARSLNQVGGLRPLVGAGLQLTSKKGKGDQGQ
jgi:hypothetical protein